MSRITIVASLGLALAALGCAKGEEPEDGGTGGAPATGLAAYDHRRVIKLSADTPADYAIAFELDHAALVESERALADGSDVRVAYEDGDDFVEIDRVADTAFGWGSDNTVIWFRTQGEGLHYVFYGEPEPEGAPLADAANIFDAYEPFDGEDVPDDYTIYEIGGGVGSASMREGALRVSGAAGDISGSSDSMVLVAQEMSDDFAIEICVRNVAGSLGAGAKAGGLMIRQSPLEDARFTMIGLSDAPRQRFTATRPIEGDSISRSTIDVDEVFPQLFRVERDGDTFNMLYSEDAITWASLGDPTMLEVLDPVLVGFPIANLSSGDAHVEIDYLRTRPVVRPTPTAELGAEEEQ